MIADHGVFDRAAQRTEFPAGSFLSAAARTSRGVAREGQGGYTEQAPGGVAYRCSFRITEAVNLVERMVDALALDMKADPIDLRMEA